MALNIYIDLRCVVITSENDLILVVTFILYEQYIKRKSFEYITLLVLSKDRCFLYPLWSMFYLNVVIAWYMLSLKYMYFFRLLLFPV